jgi:hypothetical protein
MPCRELVFAKRSGVCCGVASAWPPVVRHGYALPRAGIAKIGLCPLSDRREGIARDLKKSDTARRSHASQQAAKPMPRDNENVRISRASREDLDHHNHSPLTTDH